MKVLIPIRNIKIALTAVLAASCFVMATAQPVTEFTGPGNIGSVTLHRTEWENSYPVISLGTDETLTLKFDLLQDDPGSYYYTFEHCDKDWNRSDIFSSDWLSGFTENPVVDYTSSFNTTIPYYHFNITFPNEDMGFLISGNYIIKVYPIGEADNPVIIRRFMVTEKGATIESLPQRPKLAEYYDTHQQVDLTVRFPGISVRDPRNDLFIDILQNGRWETARLNLKADFTGSNEVSINDLSGRNIFGGLSEFRYFDIKSIRYQTEFIRSIDFKMGAYHVHLLPSDSRSGREYFYWQDQNGMYYTAVQEGWNMDTESDYVYVYFTLPSAFPVRDGEVFICGDLSGWTPGSANIMEYNYDDHTYECNMLLKQGWYNYVYAVAANDGSISFSEFEGNHYETENDYLILVYLRDPMERYDRLIGSSVTNTVNR